MWEDGRGCSAAMCCSAVYSGRLSTASWYRRHGTARSVQAHLRPGSGRQPSFRRWPRAPGESCTWLISTTRSAWWFGTCSPPTASAFPRTAWPFPRTGRFRRPWPAGASRCADTTSFVQELVGYLIRLEGLSRRSLVTSFGNIEYDNDLYSRPQPIS